MAEQRAAIDWFAVPEVQDIWEGDLVDVEVDGEPVIVVHHLDGSYAAFQGLCPHQEVVLADGKWDEDTGRLQCSGHLWEFDMRSGEGVNPVGCHLYRYPVDIDGGIVRIGVPRDGQPHYNRREQE
jgi:toluene monooxygenase system ferredoxin subunit